MMKIKGVHQTVKTASEKIYGSHLHGRDLRHVDWRTQVEVEKVTQKVTLRWNNLGLVDGGSRTTADWALTSVDAITEEKIGHSVRMGCLELQ